jgi:hypothetical protein
MNSRFMPPAKTGWAGAMAGEINGARAGLRGLLRASRKFSRSLWRLAVPRVPDQNSRLDTTAFAAATTILK